MRRRSSTMARVREAPEEEDVKVDAPEVDPPVEAEEVAEDGGAEDYSGDEEEEEDEEVDEADLEDDEPQPKRRGRPPGSKNKPRDPDDPDANSAPRKRGRPPSKNGPVSRPRVSRQPASTVPLDENGNPQKLLNDEVELPEDEEGEKKVNKRGELQGGRDFRVRTFTVLGRGDRLYMLSTEPARCMGFRDSYLLFQKHRKLYKIIVNDEEKFDLIDRDIIPHSYKGRAIGVVTARSVYREFGARIVVGGKRVIDDYYESEARAQGAVPGEIADKDDKLPPDGEPYNKNQYVAWHGASSVYHQYNNQPPMVTRDSFRELTGSSKPKKKVILTDENWRFEFASSASQYNSELVRRRRRGLKGVFEPHTGVHFLPQSTQPSECKWQKLSADKKVIIETVSHQPNIYTRTGLKNVPAEVYSHLPQQIQDAIRQQQAYESQW